MSVVEARRRRLLNGAVLQYLQNLCPKVGLAFEEYLTSAGLVCTSPTESDLLYRKWTAMTSLQLKVQQLENEKNELVKKLQFFENMTTKYKTTSDESVPQSPPVQCLKGHRQGVRQVTFHPLLLLLASCSDDGLIMVWDYENDGHLEKTLRGHTAPVQDIVFDAEGKWLASCSSDTTIKIWECASSFELSKTLYGHDVVVSCIRFLPSYGRLLSCSKDKTIKLWDIISGICLTTFSGHTEWIRALSVSPLYDGKLFASAGTDEMIILWSTEKGSRLIEFIAHTHVIEDIIFANRSMLEHLRLDKQAPTPYSLPAEQYIKKQTTLDRLSSQPKSMSIIPNGITKLSESSNDLPGPVLFSASRDRTIKMWDLMHSKCMKTFEGHKNWVKKLAIHPGGRTIVSCSDDKSVKVWDVLLGTCTKSLDFAHRSFITCVNFSLKSSVLASGSMDSDIYIWECRDHTTKQDSASEPAVYTINKQSDSLLFNVTPITNTL